MLQMYPGIGPKNQKGRGRGEGDIGNECCLRCFGLLCILFWKEEEEAVFMLPWLSTTLCLKEEEEKLHRKVKILPEVKLVFLSSDHHMALFISLSLSDYIHRSLPLSSTSHWRQRASPPPPPSLFLPKRTSRSQSILEASSVPSQSISFWCHREGGGGRGGPDPPSDV